MVQKKIMIAMPFKEAAIKFGVDEEMYNYCKRRVEVSEKYRAEHRDIIYTNTKAWIQNNSDKVKSTAAKYRKKYKVRITTHCRMRKHSSPTFRLIENVRTRMWHGLKGYIKTSKTEKLLGCTFMEFKDHIEKQFVEGMSWDNYSYRGWHVDHIKPISLFDLSKEDEQYRAFNYKNCQPLWAKDNLRKSNRYETNE